MFATAGLVLLACTSLTLIVWRIRPGATLAAASVALGLIVVIAALITGSLVTVAIVFGIGVIAWLVGEALVGHLMPPSNPFPLRAVVCFAAGNTILGLVLLVLGSLGQLNAGALAITLVVLTLTALVVTLRRTKRQPGTGCVAHGPVPLWEALVMGVVSGMIGYAMLTALSPEWMSDPVRVHLPLARQIWQTGTTWQTGRRQVSRGRLPNSAIHAQLMSIVGWAVGGDIGVKLSHSLVGLATIVGVGSLGWLLAGRTSALLAGTVFAAIPIVQWELGHAYVDLYRGPLSVAARAIAVLLWQRTGRRPMLVLGGALASFAYVSKVVSATAVAGLVIALAVVGREGWSLGRRVRQVATFSVGALLALPWIVWVFQRTGSILGLDYALGALGPLLEPGSSSGIGNLAEFGVGRSPLSILTLPWAATFQGSLFNEGGAGNIGILLLMLLPLAVFAPRRAAAPSSLLLQSSRIWGGQSALSTSDTRYRFWH